MSTPKYDWYQTESTVVLEVRIKGLKEQDVNVEVRNTNRQRTF